MVLWIVDVSTTPIPAGPRALYVTEGPAPDSPPTAKSRYGSAKNLEHAKEIADVGGTEFFISTGRSKHGERIPDAPRGRIPADATQRERMGRKLRTKNGRAVYARRKAIVEPVFGQIHTRQGKHVLLRGLEQAQNEWNLIAGCHNLLKLFTMQSRTLLPAPAGT